MNDYITVKKRNTLKIGIKDENDVPKVDENGNEVFLEFNLDDIEIIDKYSKCLELLNKASDSLKKKIVIINKKQDSKGKNELVSKNTKDKMQAYKQYYKETEEAFDLFLGKGGINKIFGEERYVEMFDDLAEMLKPILPLLKVNVDNMEKKIKEKYKINDTSVLKAD